MWQSEAPPLSNFVHDSYQKQIPHPKGRGRLETSVNFDELSPPPQITDTFPSGGKNSLVKNPECPLPFWAPKYQTPPSEFELFMEDLETLGMTTPEYSLHSELELLMKDFMWQTGVWRLPLYPSRIPSRYHFQPQHKNP